MQASGLVLGIAVWLTGYLRQRSGARRSRFVRLGLGLAWIFGNPKGNGQVDIGQAATQAVGWVCIGLPQLLALWDTNTVERSQVLLLILGLFIVGTIAIAVWAEWQNRREYRTAIQSSFAFLFSRYEFKPLGEKDNLTILDSPHCRIQLRRFLFWSLLLVTIMPLTSKPTPKGFARFAPDEVELSYLVGCRGGPRGVLLDFRRDEIRNVVQSAANLLETYGVPFLEGDFTSWPEILACAKKKEW